MTQVEAQHHNQLLTPSSKEEIDEVRNEFLKTYDENVRSGEYHEIDLKRIKDGDEWVECFYRRYAKRKDLAVKGIHDCLKWRKEFGANDLLKPGQLPFLEDFQNRNAVLVKGKDKKGYTLVQMVVKIHKKGELPHEHLCKYIAYIFEKFYKFNSEHQIVLWFNMDGAGYSNMDMDLIKYVVNCMLYYYPGLSEYTLAYQMPFVFEAAWRIIKLMLSEGLSKRVKFVNKTSIKEFIDDPEILSSL